MGSRVGSPDADRVQISVESKGDLASLVDLVATNPSMGVVASTSRCRFGSSKVGQCRRRAVLKARVRSAFVVVGSEGVEEPLELDDRGWLDLLGPHHCFMVFWNRSTFPQVVGWFGREFFCITPRRCSSVSKPLRPPLPPENRVVKTMPLSVSVEAGTP